ncbi:MAG TPA: MlaD family protein [Kofleriaceae bacterium]
MLARDDQLATRVGVIALAAIAAAIGFFVFLYPRIQLGTRVRAHVYFHDVGGLREGAAFVVAGRNAGRVESIVPFSRGATGPLTGDAGVVVTVAIDADVARRLHVRPWPWPTPPDPRRPPADVFVSSKGIVSERYLELAAAPPGSPPLRDGDKLRGADPQTLDSMLNRTLENMRVVRAFAEQVRPEFAALQVELGRLREHVAAHAPGMLIAEVVLVADQLRELRDVGLGGEAGLARTRAVVGETRGTLAELRRTLAALEPRIAELQLGLATLQSRLGAKSSDAAAKLATTLADVRTAIGRGQAVLEQVASLEGRLARGEGSLMKLLEDPEFPEDMKELGKVIKRQPWKLLPTAAE